MYLLCFRHMWEKSAFESRKAFCKERFSFARSTLLLLDFVIKRIKMLGINELPVLFFYNSEVKNVLLELIAFLSIRFL